MFAYCNNNPISYEDSTGMSLVTVLPLWDWYAIHQLVQMYIVADYGYAMEVRVKKSTGGYGRLDLFDAEKNEYYEVKHYIAAYSLDTENQMKGYDTSTIVGWMFKDYSFEESPERGTNKMIRGSFNYSIYTINYRYHSDGLITYTVKINEEAVAALATVAALSLLAESAGYMKGSLKSKVPSPAFATY